MTRFILFILLVSSLSCQTRKNSLEQSSASDTLTNKLEEIYNHGNLPGFSITLVNKNQTLYQRAFGYADIEAQREYTLKTKQPIASISKTLVGISLLKAQELGKLNLDDPINKYLPVAITNPFFPHVNITIRHLANHTSTIIDTELYDHSSYVLKNDEYLTSSTPVKVYDYFSEPKEKITISQFIQKMLYTDEKACCRDIFLNTKPGSTYKYSNGATTLAAVILELATNMSFIDFTTQYILEPLDMTSSSWNRNNTNTKLYHDADTVYVDYYNLDYPSGGLVTNSTDMSKYLTELIKGFNGNGTLLSEKSYNELFNPEFSNEYSEETFPENENIFTKIKYDKGVFMGIAPKGFIGHTGADPGTVTFMFFNAKTNLGFVFITNRLIWWQFEDALNDLWAIIDIMATYTSNKK
jgi:CubicO group peptidase (beta-lactamase class C family)